MATPTIKISVSQADATLIQTCTLTAGMVSLPTVKFSFSEEWTGLGKTAVVRAGSEVQAVLIVNNQITVPVECLATAGVNLIIGIYGANADDVIVLPTVWCSCGEVLDGTVLEEAENIGEATSTLVDQMLSYAEDISEIADTLETYAIRNVAVNTAGANQYGIATVTLNDSGVGDDRTITFYFSNLKGNGVESIAWSPAGTQQGTIRFTESNGTVTDFTALVDAVDYLNSLTDQSEAWAVGTIDGEDIPNTNPAYNNYAKYWAGEAADSATDAGTAQTAAETAQGLAETAQGKAEDAQTAAEAAQAAAELAEDNAGDSATAAAGSAESAEGYATSASNAAGTATDAKDAAVAAQTAAETAQGAAEAASSSASGYATAAQGSANLAQSYSSHPPTINSSTSNWMSWNVDGQQYEDTGLPSRGIQGETGDAGVEIGSTTPTDPDVGVWIDTSGSPDPIVQSSTVTTIWTGTQAEYDLLTPDANTLYVIKETSS